MKGIFFGNSRVSLTKIFILSRAINERCTVDSAPWMVFKMTTLFILCRANWLQPITLIADVVSVVA